MRPTLLSIGPFDFHGYTVMLSLAFLACTLLCVRENYRLARPYNITPIAGIWLALGGIIGAKAYWYLQYDHIRNIYRALYLWEPGLVFYGGLLGGCIAGMIYMRVNRVPIIPISDLALPYVTLGIGITRVGCFLNGCCWGKACELPWAITFPSRSIAYRGIAPDGKTLYVDPFPVHPTELYSVLGLLLIFFFLRYLYKRPHPTGGIALMFGVTYGIMRFMIEHYRGDSAESVFGMTVSQAVSLGMFAICGFAFIALWASVWHPRRGKTWISLYSRPGEALPEAEAAPLESDLPAES